MLRKGKILTCRYVLAFKFIIFINMMLSVFFLLRHDLHEPKRGGGHSSLNVCFDRLRTAGFESGTTKPNRRVASRQTPYFCPATKVCKNAFT